MKIPTVHAMNTADAKTEDLLVKIKQLCIENNLSFPMSSLKKMDRIEIPMDRNGEISMLNDEQFETCRQMPAIDSMPVLEEGVIKYVIPKPASPIWTYFRLEKVNMDEKAFTVYYQNYVNAGKDNVRYIMACSWRADISANGKMSDSCRMEIYDIMYPSSMLDIISRTAADISITDDEYKMLKHIIKQFTESIKSQNICVTSTKLASAVFSQLTCLMMLKNAERPHPQKTGGATQETTPKKHPAANAQKNAVRVITLGGPKISIQPGSTAKIRKNRIFTRYTDAWTVRSHIRHYKNGSTARISAYKKGPGRKTADILPKQHIYKIKERAGNT